MRNKDKKSNAAPEQAAAKSEAAAVTKDKKVEANAVAAPKAEKQPNKVLIAIAYAAVLFCIVMVCFENAAANGIIG